MSSQLDSPLKAHLAPRIPAGAPGFHLLHAGHAALAQRATRTLDVQTYLFHNDTTGKLVAAALLAATERGVRVRLLVNDIDSADKELRLATLDVHPNIEVRLFNPFHTRSANLLVKSWQALRDHVRLNRRMHNKALIADNQIAIAGGRNAKAFVFDDTHVFIGSFNFDPRSVLLNTEMGLVIDPPDPARDLAAIAEDAMRPERSYRPELVVVPSAQGSEKYLRWHDVHDGAARVTEAEPETTPIQRGLLRVLQALPIEQHL